MRSRLLPLGGALLALAGAGGCGARPHGGEGGPAVAGTAVTLYRGLALIEQRVDVDIPASGRGTARATLAAGTTIGEVEVTNLGDLKFSALHLADAPANSANPANPANPVVGGVAAAPRLSFDDDTEPFAARAPEEAAADAETAANAEKPLVVELEVHGPPGPHAVTLAYTTPRITWETAYTMTTTPDRGRVEPRGAIAIRNGTGVVFTNARIAVVDDALVAERDRLADQIAALALGRSALVPADSHPARPHPLGRLDLADGEVRAELYPEGQQRTLRSVLLYDPVGAKLDNPTPDPVREEAADRVARTPEPVSESVEIVRDTARDLGLPGGPARLVERRADGSLVVLAEGRMFDAPTRVATFDTIPIGVAKDVLGHRARRDFDLDDDHRRLTEDVTIDLENQRSRPVTVVMIEHMYRSNNWSLAFNSVPVELAGAQAISLRTEVPARGKASVLYVVVYWWDEHK